MVSLRIVLALNLYQVKNDAPDGKGVAEIVEIVIDVSADRGST